MASLKDLMVLGPARFLDNIYGNLKGNADSATKLKNKRSFTIGNTAKDFNGEANVSWTTTEIGAVQQKSYSTAIDANTLYDTGVYNITSAALSNGPTSYAYGQIFTLAYRKPTGNSTPDHAGQLYIHGGGSANELANVLCFRASDSSTWSAWQMVAHGTSNTAVGSSTRPVYMAKNGTITATSYTAIAYGGTGTTTAPTQGGIIYASSTTAYASTAAGSSGQLLQSAGTGKPTWITATNSNTGNTIVKRDDSGNFSAGTITATLNGAAAKLSMHSATTANTAGLYIIPAGGATVGNTVDYSADTPDVHSSSVQYGTILRIKYNNANVYYTDIYSDTNTNALLFKTVSNGTSRGWTRIVDSTYGDGRYLKLSGGTMTGVLTLGSHTQAVASSSSGITINDLRETTPTPDFLGDKVVNWYFDQQGYDDTWKSIMHIKGWTGSYAAWELSGPASSSTPDILQFRVGIGTTWNAWRSVAHIANKTAVGSASVPIYVDATGKLIACTASSLFSALSWTAGTTAGPTLSVTVAGQTRTAVIPSASSSASGIVTTGTQTFAGVKTFNSTVYITGSFVTNGSTRYPVINFRPLFSGNNAGRIYYEAGSETGFTDSHFFFREHSYSSTASTACLDYWEDFHLPKCDENRTANGGYNILTTKSAVTIPQGGTNATTAGKARVNLGITTTETAMVYSTDNIIASTTAPTTGLVDGMIWLELTS